MRNRRTREDLEAEIRQLRGELALNAEEHAEERAAFLEAQNNLELLCQRYSDLFDFAPVGYLRLDLAGCISEANNAAAEQLGYNIDHLVNRPLLAFVAPSDRRRWMSYLSGLRRHRTQSKTIEINFVRRGHQRTTLQLICSRERTAGEMCHAPLLRIAMLNVTDLRQAQETARLHQDRLHALIRHAPGYIFVLDSEGTITFQSPNSQYFAGGSIFNIIHQKDQPQAHKLFDQVRKSRDTLCEADLQILSRNRQWRWMHVVAKNLGADPSVGGIVLNTHDISQRVEVEKQLQLVNETLEDQVQRRTRQLQQANERLRGQIAERQRLERQVLIVSEREQERIAQELHDGLQQEMAGIAYLGDAVHQSLREKGAAEAADAAEIARFASAAQKHARALAHGLRPIDDDPIGLMAALKMFAEMVRRMFRIRCRFVCQRPVKIKDATVSTHLYRIAQEALYNAIRHGSARNVTIFLTRKQGKICLHIRNDGKKFPSHLSNGGGMGLRTMRYRAQAMGGILSVRALSQEGTDVYCEVPVAKKDSSAKEASSFVEAADPSSNRLVA